MVDNITVRADPAEAETDVYVGLEHLDPESLHLRQWGAPADVTGQKFAFKKGDIIFGRRRAYQRKLAVAEFDGICSAHAMVVRAKPKVVDPQFLPFFMQSDMFMKRAIGISVGSLSPTINWRDLQVQEFPLPPIEKQRRIAELLWAVDDALERWKSVTECLNTCCSLALISLAHGNGIPEDKEINEVTCLVTDGDHNPPKRCASGIPHLVVQNVSDGMLRIDGCTHISKKDFARVEKRYSPRADDLVLTCVGTIGRAALVPPGFVFSADRSLAILRFDTNRVLPQYALAVLRSQSLQQQMERASIGTAQKHLFLGDIRKLRLPIPDIKTQENVLSIVARFGQVGRCIEDSVSKLSAIKLESLSSIGDMKCSAS